MELTTNFDIQNIVPNKHCYIDCDGGQNISIQINWFSLTTDVKSFAVAIIDIHPIANKWIHWFVTDIPADSSGLSEGISGANLPKGCVEHLSTGNIVGYEGPHPPVGSGRHFYEVYVYALNCTLAIGRTKFDFDVIQVLLKGKVLESGKLSFFYER